jgi:hypothetical protein
MALPMRSMAQPIVPYDIAIRSGYALQVPSFGATPFRQNGLAGLKGAGCGCDPVGGCGCKSGGVGLHGILDDLSNAFGTWLGSASASASDPCNPNSPVFDAARCTAQVYQKNPFLQWVPWIIGGIVVYKLIK